MPPFLHRLVGLLLGLASTRHSCALTTTNTTQGTTQSITLAPVPLCPGTNISENVMAAADYQENSRGLLMRVYPNYAPLATASIPTRNESLDDVHFTRVAYPQLLLASGESINTSDFHSVASRYTWSTRFLVTWEGRLVVPCSGNYTFRVAGDDGIRFVLNGKQMLSSNAWVPQAIAWYASPTVYLEAGSVNQMKLSLFQVTGNVALYFQWQRPGRNQTFDFVPQRYMIPSTGPAVRVSRYNVLNVNATGGPGSFDVTLSERPASNVVVKIANPSPDMLGFDRCQILFTPYTWNNPQTVSVAIKPGAPGSRSVDDRTPMLVMLNASSSLDQYDGAKGLVQIINPSQSSVNPTTCVGYGDPHYTTWDGAHYNLYLAGVFTMARDYPGDFVVQTHLAPCDPTAKVTCTFLAYLKWKTSVLVVSMDGLNPLNAVPNVAVVTGDGAEVSVERVRNSEITMKLPTGVEVNVRVGFFRMWTVPFWRYLSLYITAPGSQQRLITGLCGNFDGSDTNDATSSTVLNTTWFVPQSQQMHRGNGQAIPALTNPNPPTVKLGGSTTTKTITTVSPLNFTLDPLCSGMSQPRTIVPDRGPPEFIEPPPVPANYTPLSVNVAVPANVTNSCQQYINPTVCPNLNASTINASVSACATDAFLAGGMATPDLAAPFVALCDTSTSIKISSNCKNCTAKQTCVGGVCVTTVPPCGGMCDPIGGTCVNSTCVCKPNYYGPACDVYEQRCGNLVCTNGGTCVNSTCVCPAQFTGAQCERISTVTCASNPCQNGAMCVQNSTGLQCLCAPGWEGDRCQINSRRLAKAIATGNICCIRKARADIQRVDLRAS